MARRSRHEQPDGSPYQWVRVDAVPAQPERSVPTAAAGSGRAGRLRAVVVAAFVIVLLGAGIGLVVMPDDEVVSAPTTTVERAAGTTTTTTVPELRFLRGRPPSPVDLDEQVCAPALVAGRLKPASFDGWDVRSAPVAAAPIDDRGAREEIERVMRRRFRAADPGGAAADALALYDSARVRAVTGDSVSLRAALAELKGTIAEPTLRFALTTWRPLSIRFGDLVRPDAFGEAWTVGDRLDVIIRSTLAGERPALLAPIVAHELLHQTGTAFQAEEITLGTIDARVALEVVRDAPEATTGMTPATAALRWNLWGQLNTRIDGALAVTRSDVPDIYAGLTAPMPSYMAELQSRPHYDRLPAGDAGASYGHETLTEVLRLIGPVPDGSRIGEWIDADTLAFLDRHAGVGACDQLVAAEALRLVPRGPASTAARAYLDGLGA